MVLWTEIFSDFNDTKAILLVHEYEKQGKIKDEYRRVFDALKKAKPGIDVIIIFISHSNNPSQTYQYPEETAKKSYDIIDGSLFNFLTLLTVLVIFSFSTRKSHFFR